MKFIGARLVCGLLVASACSTNVYAPPSRVPVLEPAPTAGMGRTELVGQIGSHGDLFGPTLNAGGFGVRHGLQEHLDLVLDGAFGTFSGQDEIQEDREIGLARVGVKYGVGDGRILALRGGVGGGYAPASGGMVSTDIGAVLSGPWKYVVPWIAGMASVSAPIGRKNVLVATDPIQFDRANTTGGLGASLGVRVGTDVFSAAIGFSMTTLANVDGNDQFASIGISIHHILQ